MFVNMRCRVHSLYRRKEEGVCVRVRAHEGVRVCACVLVCALRDWRRGGRVCVSGERERRRERKEGGGGAWWWW